jgi:peptidoglycan/LPS O-acetylase OafA/YrhL
LAATHSIPSLDGLRAISIALVVFAHSFSDASRWPSRLGQHGVDIFFVISGFLITRLLLKELERNGNLSLRKFYLRRFFRIFPAFYVFLAILGLLWHLGMVPLDARSYAAAATYTYNYDRYATGWLLSHCWSLSLEEQFYLLWPPCLALLGKKNCTWLAGAIIVLDPALRVVSYVVAPSFRGLEAVMLHTRLDIIMFGCIIALLFEHEKFNRLIQPLLRPSLVGLATLFFLIMSPFLESRFQARYTWLVGYTLRGLAISLVLLYVVRNSTSLAGRFLNRKLIRHIGVISYSIYLWQQVFTGPRAIYFPLNILFILVCAEASFAFVERPAFKLRDWVEEKILPRAQRPIVAET